VLIVVRYDFQVRLQCLVVLWETFEAQKNETRIVSHDISGFAASFFIRTVKFWNFRPTKQVQVLRATNVLSNAKSIFRPVSY
jgi:hypothetical protein